MAGGLSGSAKQVYGYFRQRGLSPAQAAGVTGNTQQESSNNPNAPGGGLIQGQGGRTSSGTLQQQLEGVWRELQGPERGTLNALQHAHSSQEAARIFSQRFERPGIPMLGNRERYAREALQQFGGLGGLGSVGGGGGTAAQPGASVQQQTSTSPAQLADLMALIDQSSQRQSAPSVAGVELPKPGSSEPGQLPRALELPSAPASVSPASLLAALTQIGQDGEGTQAVQEPGTPGSPASGGSSSGGYVNPLPGFKLGRTDMGVDANAPVGTPIRAIGNAKVLGIAPDWYQGQPYVSYELLDGPRKGQVVYVAEQITPSVKAGQHVRAGQAIGHYAPTGTGIETGFGTRTLQQTQAQATTGYTEGQETPAGKQARRLLEQLGAR